MGAPLDTVLESTVQAAQSELERVASRWELPADRVETVVRVGDPAEHLLDVVKLHECTLLVLGSHGRTRWTGRCSWRASAPATPARRDPTRQGGREAVRLRTHQMSTVTSMRVIMCGRRVDLGPV
jgi:hypothetical protein